MTTSATLNCTPTRLSQPRNEEVNTNKSNNNKASVVGWSPARTKNYSLPHWQKTPSPILVRLMHYCCVECCNHSNHQFVRLVCKAVLNKKAQKCLLTPIVNTVRLILFSNSIIKISCSLRLPKTQKQTFHVAPWQGRHVSFPRRYYNEEV